MSAPLDRSPGQLREGLLEDRLARDDGAVDAAQPESPEEEDPAMARIRAERKPGEIETGMMSGSDEAEISATERFEGELTPKEAVRVLRGGPGSEPDRR